MFSKVMRAVFTLIGFAFGYTFITRIHALPALTAGLPSWGQAIAAIIGALFFGLIFFLITPAITKAVQKSSHWLEKYLLVLPGQDLVAGSAGIIMGLLIGTLLIYPFREIIPVFGPYLAIIANIFLAWVGAIVAVKKREDLVAVFRMSKIPMEMAGGKEKGGAMPKILDTSVIIDGRIADICDAGFLDGKIIIPSFVLEELRHIADSSDTLKRNRGRRGLDILNRIQKEINIPVHVLDDTEDEGLEVDSRLVKLAQRIGGKVVTNDYNLNKVCELQGVPVLNINELANAVKPVVLPGEEMDVQIIKDGKESGQGIAYLDDGTMIVVDGGRSYIGNEISVLVTSVLQTAAGRMIFARLKQEKIS
ncbi:MAG TPA: PIN domain nuclease [Firmicutes bacterium]|nr:PIN domain nuclease [Bacillota bacterium]HBS93609.1 PIN domain nuclease [Bacillota bacterium]